MENSLKNVLPIIVAIILGVVSVIAVNRYIAAKTETQAVKQTGIIVTAQTLSAGEEIDMVHLGVKTVPEDMVSGINIEVPLGSGPKVEEQVKLKKAMLVGRTSNRMISTGDPIYWTDLTKSEATTLADKIPEGKRAVTIPVDSLTGVGLNIVPGDRVDVLASRVRACNGSSGMLSVNPTAVRDLMAGAGIPADASTTGMSEPNSNATKEKTEPITYVLMQNVLVLAAGRDFNTFINAETKHSSYSTVTLEVSIEEAVMLAHARDQVSLSLVLRPPTGLDRLPPGKIFSIGCSAIMGSWAQKLDEKRAKESMPPPPSDDSADSNITDDSAPADPAASDNAGKNDSSQKKADSQTTTAKEGNK